MMHLSLEDLVPFHVTRHTDLEAIFGGHISGRRLRGVKINPIFHDQDSSSEDSPLEADQTSQRDGTQELISPFNIDIPVHVDVYESLPRSGQHARLLRHQSELSSSRNQHQQLYLDLDPSKVHSLPRTSYLYNKSRNISFSSVHRDVSQNSGSLVHMSNLRSKSVVGNRVLDMNCDESTMDPAIKGDLDYDDKVNRMADCNSDCLSKWKDDRSDSLRSISEVKEEPEISLCNNLESSVVDNLTSLHLEESTDHSNCVRFSSSDHKPSLDLSSLVVDTQLSKTVSGDVSVGNKSFSLPQDPKSVHDSNLNVQPVHEDDVQENVLLYSSDADSSPTGDLMAAPNQISLTDEQSDWPDIDDLALPCDEVIKQCQTLSKEEDYCNLHDEESSMGDKSVISDIPDETPSSSTSTTKPLKPILLSGEDDKNCAKKPEVLSCEIKTVTFADGTVFNEDKPKRYQNEKVNLKELYRDRICGKPGFGLVNPVFVLSEDDGIVEEGLTDDEKVKRNSFRINLVNASPAILDNVSLTSEGSSPTAIPKPLPDLNTPAYMKKYLTRSTCSKASEEAEPGETILSMEDQEAHINSVYNSTDIIHITPVISSPPRMLTQPKRRKILQGFVLVMAALIVIATAVGLGIFFTQRKDAS